MADSMNQGDANNQNINTQGGLIDQSNRLNTPTQQCPQCGYCPTCGRKNPYTQCPYYQYPSYTKYSSIQGNYQQNVQ